MPSTRRGQLPQNWPENGEGVPVAYSQLFVHPPKSEAERWRTTTQTSTTGLQQHPPAAGVGVLNSGPGLTIQEDYGFDVKGYLHLRGLFTEAEVAALLEAEGHKESAAEELLRQQAELHRYLDHLMGEGYSVLGEMGQPSKLRDGPLQWLRASSAASAEQEQQPALRGGGELLVRSRGWVAREGHRFAQGMRVIVALGDAPAGHGGVCVVPCTTLDT
jgi:hypothetical protein